MELKEALLKRRSCRKYLDKKVEEELIEELMVAAMSGPSACNKKPWKFYVVTDEEKLEQLRYAGRAFNYPSPLNIIVCGDKNKKLLDKVEDFWIQDCSASVENILLMATALGLGTCWCGVFPVDERVESIRKILSIEENLIPLGLIHIGYPDCEMEARSQYDKEDIVRI